MTDDDRIRLLEKTLDRTIQAIHATDTKVYCVLALDTLLVGALVALLPPTSLLTVSTLVAFAISCLPITCSLVFVLFVAFPRLTGPQSLLFFHAIKERHVDELVAGIRAITQDQYLADLAGQVHRNSEIASAKYRLLRVSIGSMLCAIPLWLTAVFILRF